MWKKTYLLHLSLLLAVSLLLAPKIILVNFFSNRWIDSSLTSTLLFLMQDFILAVTLYLIAITTVTKKNLYFYLLSVITGALLLFLLLDMRVRELWLKPLDWPLIKYGLQNSSDLLSGLEIFLKQSSGFGFTFRFIAFVLFLAYLATWLLVWFARKARDNQAATSQTDNNRLSIILITTLAALFIGSIYSKDARYDLNENIFVNPLVDSSRNITSFNASEGEPVLDFEQPAYPLSAINKIQKLDSRPTPEFKNLVFIILESVRWNSLFNADVNTGEKYPTFERLSREGMLFKSYVTVPHSSKGYYSILTGRHAYPDIEIKEAMHLFQPSIIHELIKKKNMEAVAFSSLYLQFENMDGFLKSIGVSSAYQASALTPATASPQNNSSFGDSDEHLYASSVPFLKDITQQGKGFITLYFPSAAHYPYNCSNDPSIQIAIKKYEDCIMKTDTLLGDMLNTFEKSGLLDSTLFVLVGDHGESFGEHGTYLHNSSMHEEEVTVPLIFWANGKVLARTTSTTSQQTDIVPTIADLFGMTDSQLDVQGVSLLREQGKRTFFMSTFFDQLSSALVEHPDKYIYDYSSDSVTKYNIESDPQEKSPQIVQDAEFNSIKKRLLSYNEYQKAVFAKKPEQSE
jgi:glucan phosphoethanolaminetransferase (alkaline phosphatase superfamily)